VTSQIGEKAYRLGILFQIFAGHLVNFAIGKDTSAVSKLDETKSILQDAFRSLDISVSLPDLHSEEEVVEFFQQGFPKLTMEIGKRLSVLHGTDASNIFHFSTGAAGYFQTHKQTNMAADQFEVLRRSLEKQAEDLRVDSKRMQRFFLNPEDEWDRLFQDLLEDKKEGWTDLVEIKPGIAGLSFDLKKAASLISDWLSKKDRS